jgi:hypothetical protein
METEVFVFTAAGEAAQEHYRRTIESPVPLEEVAGYEPGVAADLTAAGHDAVRCWGSVPGSGNRRSWERMRPGHWAMLYVGGGRFPLLLRVAHKAHSRPLAERLWDRDADGDTWELMFFFDQTRPADLDIDQVRGALGYGDDWWPQGLQYPTPEHQEALLEKFGSIEAFASSVGAGDGSSGGGGGRGLASGRDGGMSAEELLLGKRFKGAPDKPPRVPRHNRPLDPDVTGRGYLAHERTVELLCRHVGPGFRKGTPRVNHDGAWAVDGGFSIAEVKSNNSSNDVSQLQKGLGQVQYNRIKAERNGAEIVAAYLVAEREPVNSALWVELCTRGDVVFTWSERFETDIPRPPEPPAAV